MVRMSPAHASVGDKEKDSFCFGARKYGIRSLLEEARGSMKVRGRDAMAGSSADLKEECELKLADAGSQEGETPPERGNKCTICHLHLRLCACQTSKKKTTAADDEARERALLRELYAALLAPVEAALAGADELLIVPHMELFEVPWAALIDAQGRFLIERCVLRVAPSLRVAQQAAGKVTQRPGHVVLVGNPLPIQTRFRPLPFAEQEAQGVHDILNRAGVEVNQKHFFRSDLTPKATKANVKKSLQGAGWVHFACHADIDTDSLVLAVPDSSDPDHAHPNLPMLEVQGSDEAADKSEGVRLGYGATAFMSACNTAKGKIKAEGVVGMSRGFQMAGAAATVVSLWSVDDLSTAVLMQQTYRHLVCGCTVPQALRLAMLRLARRPALHQPAPGDQETGAGERSGADTAEGARGGGEELGGFRRLEEGGSRSAGGGGAVPAVQGFLDMLEGVRQGGSSREAQPSVRAVPPVRIHEDEAERRAYWREFCRRDVAPTCVLDFPFADHGADHGRLNLSGDERLLERLYCFEDHEDDAHQLLGGERRRVILKVHTLLKWGSRGNKLYQRAVKVTAAKVLLARVCSCRCSCGCITVASRVLRACCSACARRQGSTPHKYAGR
jgi:CHAT domain-containing protein